MGLKELREGYARILAQIYSPRNYYRRLRTFLREYRTPTAKTPFEWQRFLALPRSMIRLGVIGRERVQYWRLLAWTLLHRPRLLSHAVTLAISGYHFRLVCQAMAG
jgi:hypothetical protein